MDINALLKPGIIDTCLVPRGLRIILALAIFVIGRWIAKLVVRFARGVMYNARLKPELNMINTCPAACAARSQACRADPATLTTPRVTVHAAG